MSDVRKNLLGKTYKTLADLEDVLNQVTEAKLGVEKVYERKSRDEMVMVPTVGRREALTIHNLREEGMTYKQIAKVMQRDKGMVAKYHRILERYGIGAFAK